MARDFTPQQLVVIGGAAVGLYLLLGRTGGPASGRFIPILVVPGAPMPPPPPGAPPIAPGTGAICGPDNPELCAVPGMFNPADPGIPFTTQVNSYCTNNISDPICVGPDQGGGGASIFSTLPGGASGPVVLVP